MSLPTGIFTGEVIAPSPNEHSVLVAIPGNDDPVTCALMHYNGGSSSSTYAAAMPLPGASAIVIVPSNSRIGYIAGYYNEPGSYKNPPENYDLLDPMSKDINTSNHRGDGDPILPGDFVIKSQEGAYLEVNAGDQARVGSSKAGAKYSTSVLGMGEVVTHTDTFRHTNAQGEFSLQVDDTLSTTMRYSGYVGESTARNTYLEDGQTKSNLEATIGGDSAFSVTYTGGTEESYIRIDRDGAVRIQGSQVFVSETSVRRGPDGRIIRSSNILETVKGSRSLGMEGDDSLTVSGSSSTTIGGASIVSSGGDYVISSGKKLSISASGRSLASDGPPTPGSTDSFTLSSLSGDMVISSGSVIPGAESAYGPQIRLEADSGGDIVLDSSSGLGAGGVSGAVMISSPLPGSRSGHGGSFNYGVVINSPNVLLSNVPGIPTIPDYLPQPFIPPVPPVTDALVKHTALATWLLSLEVAIGEIPGAQPALATLIPASTLFTTASRTLFAYAS